MYCFFRIAVFILFLVFAAIIAPAGEPDGAEQLRFNEPLRPVPNTMTPIDVNPPTFRWRGDGRNKSTVQIVREGAPWEKAATYDNIGETFFRPLQPLEPGRYTWRVRQGNAPWVGPETFDVTDGIARWAIEPWAKVFARFRTGHPRILATSDNLPTLRTRAGGDMRSFVEQWAQQMEKKVGAELPVFEYEGGKDDDSKMRQRKKLMWSAEKMTRELLNDVGEMAFLGMLLDRNDLAEEAIRRAMRATALDPKGLTSHVNSDFASGLIVQSVGRVYDYLYERLTAEQRKAMRETILSRGLVYRPKIEQMYFQPHGWQDVMQDHITGSMAIWDEEPRAKEWLEWAAKMSVAMFPWYGGADGGSVEGGSYYGNMDLPGALALAALWRNFANLEIDRNPWYRNTGWFLIYTHQPGGGVSRFGDHGPAYPPPHAGKAVAALMSGARNENPFLVAYARRVLQDANATGAVDISAFGRYLTPEMWLADGPFDASPTRPLADLPPARVFRDVGLAFLHTAYADPASNVRLEFRSSPFAAYGHSHMDQNSFNIMAAGEELILDSGHYIAYGDEHHAGWTQQTKAHNGILIDGKGQGPRGLLPYGQIVGFAQGPGWAWFCGDATKSYDQTKLERFLRHVLWLGGPGEAQTFLVCDLIRVAGAGQHDYEWLLHFPTKPVLDEAAKTAAVTGMKARALVGFLGGQDWKFALTDAFDPPVENWRDSKKNRQHPNQWHLTAEIRQAAPQQRFLTAITVGTTTGTLTPVAVTQRDETIRCGDFEIRFEDGQLQLERNGQRLAPLP